MRPRMLLAATVLLSVAAAGAGSAAGAAAPAPAGTTGAPVTAVVTLRPGAQPLATVPGRHVLAVLPHVGAEIVRLPADALARLAADPRVAGVSLDRPGRVSGRDGRDGRDGHDGEGDGGGDDSSARPAAVMSWEGLGAYPGRDTGRGVNVALLDTGVTDTAALNRASGRITDGVDVSRLASGGTADTSGRFTDGYGHGTFLASIIAGGPVPATNGRPVGVAPAARIVVVKVADDLGRTSLSEVLAGLDWVAAHARAIQVVNLSLAVEPPNGPTAYGADPLTAAVEHVRAAGVLVVAAAGNIPGRVGDPGMDPQALTVGAADLTAPGNPVTAFSGSGVVAGVAKPDLVASGAHVVGVMPADSTIARTNPGGWLPGGLFRGSGTSEATAITSGAAAALLSYRPGTSPSAVKQALRGWAVGRSDPRAGAGLLHAPNGNAYGKAKNADTGESGFDARAWQAHAWQGGNWASWLASSWSGPAWDASSWSASTWSASSWSASSWSASSWSASSWSASSWSASSWSASSWSASSWSDYGWGDS